MINYLDYFIFYKKFCIFRNMNRPCCTGMHFCPVKIVLSLIPSFLEQFVVRSRNRLIGAMHLPQKSEANWFLKFFAFLKIAVDSRKFLKFGIPQGFRPSWFKPRDNRISNIFFYSGFLSMGFGILIFEIGIFSWCGITGQTAASDVLMTVSFSQPLLQ